MSCWRVLLPVFTSVLAGQAAAQNKSPDWEKLKPEILDRYRSLVQIDTTAGHETQAVEYLKKILEAESTGVGINYMVREHFDEIDAEFAMTEGGNATIGPDGKRVSIVNIGTAEKLPARVRLVATGTAGHGSVPRLDNALIHLGAAVEKIGRWETPMRLNDTTRTYFEKLATISAPEVAARYKALLDPQQSAAAQRYLAEKDPGRYSM